MSVTLLKEDLDTLCDKPRPEVEKKTFYRRQLRAIKISSCQLRLILYLGRIRYPVVSTLGEASRED